VLVVRLRDDAFVRNNAVYLAGSVVAGAFGYVFHFVSGRLLGPAGYGVVAATIAVLYVLTLPAPILQIVSMRFVSLAAARSDPGRIRTLLQRVTVISLIVGALIGLLLALFGGQVAAYLVTPDVRVVYVLIFATAAGLLVAGNRGALQGTRRFLALSVNMLVDNVSRVVGAAVLIMLGLGPVGALLGVVLGPAVAYLHSLALLRQPAHVVADETVSFGDVGRYALPAAMGVIGITYLFNIDIVLAKHYLPAAEAGIYAAGAVLARVVYFLGVTIAAVMFPEVATLHARDRAHFHVVDRSLLFLAAISIAFVAAYVLLPGLVLLPYGSSFDSVRGYLGPFAIALSMLSLSNLLVSYFLSLNSARFIGPLVAACVLETVLIPFFHAGIGQIVAVVVLTTTALALALGLLYGVDRRARRAASG
jgi:O-antigen/teichoic acid export membrane protein